MSLPALQQAPPLPPLPEPPAEPDPALASLAREVAFIRHDLSFLVSGSRRNRGPGVFRIAWGVCIGLVLYTCVGFFLTLLWWFLITLISGVGATAWFAEQGRRMRNQEAAQVEPTTPEPSTTRPIQPDPFAPKQPTPPAHDPLNPAPR